MNKICSKCKKKKKVTDFRSCKGYKNDIYSICKECEYEYQQNDERKEYRKRWVKNNPSKIKKNHKKWREGNPEKIRENERKWRKENPEKNSVKCKNYKARKKGAEGSHTLKEWLDKKKEYNHRCVYCGIHEDALKKKYKDKRWHKLTEDHVIPLSKSGSNYISNILPACISCNDKKSNKICQKIILK